MQPAAPGQFASPGAAAATEAVTSDETATRPVAIARDISPAGAATTQAVSPVEQTGAVLERVATPASQTVPPAAPIGSMAVAGDGAEATTRSGRETALRAAGPAAAPDAQAKPATAGANVLSQPAATVASAGPSALTAAAPSPALVTVVPSLPTAAAVSAAAVSAAASSGASTSAAGASAAESASPVADHRSLLRAADAAADPAQPAVSDPAPQQVIVADTTSQPAAAMPTAAAPQTPQASPAAPAAQVAPALVTLATTADGNHQTTVRLQPDDLGVVQIRIERSASGATQITVSAEKSDTLQALQRDQPELHRALDEAGIPAAGRSLTFHVAASDQASSGSGEPGSGAGQQGSPHRSPAANTDADGASGNGRGSYPAREQNAYSTSRRSAGASDAAVANAAAAAARSYRAGLDITA